MVNRGSTQTAPVYILNMIIELGSMIMVVLLLSSIRSLLDHQKRLAQTDSLTGAMNSVAFLDAIRHEIIRSNRYRHPFSVVYFDIDDFKKINDQFGHTTGDEVLRSVVSKTRKHLRQTDIVGRLGGDEFGILLPESNSEAAESVVTKIRQEISDSGSPEQLADHI